MLALSDSTAALAIVASVWVTVGITLGVVMGRRGHGAFQWLFIGAVLGPIALPIAWGRMRDEQETHVREISTAAPGLGPTDLLVGIDGSPESEAALLAAVRLVGSKIGRLTLASVTDFDHGTVQARADATKARESLERSAALTGASEPGMAILSGRPADALADLADREGYAVLVIGRRGRGLSKAILGSTASQLAQKSSVPVLIV